MIPRATAALRRLEQASWFSRVGIKEGPGVVVLGSWPEAIEHCDSIEWEDLRLEALNQYREYIVRRSKERWEMWNETVDDVRKITEPFVARKIATIVRAQALPELFRTRVDNDMIGVCMEAEYSDVCPPGFYTYIGDCYFYGHFPCGWWGVFPDGNLVVY
jgi:hypothetical protein